MSIPLKRKFLPRNDTEKPREARIREALLVHRTSGRLIRELALDYNVPRATLQDRKNSKITKQEDCINRQKLTAGEEKH